MLGKRREREETSFEDTVAAQNSEDDEGESKSRVIHKRSRPDPFLSKKKGKGPSAPITVPREPQGNPPAFEIKPEKEKLVAIPPAGGDDPGPSLSKKGSNMASAPK